MFKIKKIISSIKNLDEMSGPHKGILYLAIALQFLNFLIDGLITFSIISVGLSFFDINNMPAIFDEFLNFFKINDIQSSNNSGILAITYLILVLILKTLFTFLGSYTSSVAKNRIISHIRYTTIKKSLLIDFSNFYLIQTGSLEQIVALESKVVANAYLSFVLSLNGIFHAIFILIFFYILEPISILLLVLLGILFVPFKYFYSLRIKNISEKAKQYDFNFMKKLSHIIKSTKEIRASNTESKNLIDVKKKAIRIADKIISYQTMIFLEPTFIQIFILTSALALFIPSVNYGVINISVLSSALFILYRSLPHITKASKNFNQFLSLIPGAQRTYNIYSLEVNNKTNYKNDNNDIIDISSIELKDVTFQYSKSEIILKSISVKFNKGETIYLSGDSGSGKSSFLNLLILLYPPVTGDIYINGRQHNKYLRSEILNSISFVGQNQSIPEKSIYNILKTSNEELSIDEALELLDIVYMKETIIKLPNGINTIIGDKGINLSGGQLQRISIAASLVKKKSCFIFDEATSELDINLEKKIYLNIKKYLNNKIIIFTSHRKNNLPIYDISYLIKNNKINKN